MKLRNTIIASAMAAMATAALAGIVIDSQKYFGFVKVNTSGETWAISHDNCTQKIEDGKWQAGQAFIARHIYPACWADTADKNRISFCIVYSDTKSDCHNVPKKAFHGTQSLPRGAQF